MNVSRAKPSPVAAPTSGSCWISSTNCWLKLTEPPLVELTTYSARTVEPIVARSWALIEAAKTVAPVTRATPMSTGAAVRAVRFGLRCTLPRAIAPVTPRTASTGAPSTRAIGFASAGPTSRTPAKTRPMPTPSSNASAPASTTPIAAAPSATATPATINRTRTEPVRS